MLLHTLHAVSNRLRGWLVPRRSTQREQLDAPVCNGYDLVTNLADIRDVNRWLGGSASIIRAVAPFCNYLSAMAPERAITVLDVGTGSADIPLALTRWAQKQRLMLRVCATDVLLDVLWEAHRYTQHAIPPISLACLNALQLPYAANTFDIVICAQTLHHFDPPEAVVLLGELARVARFGVVVGDLRRSWFAYVGARLLACVQRSSMSRHDGPLSVLRAYTMEEIADLTQRAGLHAQVKTDGLLRLVLIVQKDNGSAVA